MKSQVKVNDSIISENIKSDIFNNLNCIQVGQIQSFDATKQTATIQIMMKRTLNDESVIDYAPLVDCPCICLSGELGGVDIPISKGDSCLILFNDRSINEWWVSNQSQIPQIYRTHDFSDAFALVGVRNLQTLINGYLTNAVRIWYNSNSMIMTDNLTTFNNPIKASYKSSDGSVGITTTQTIEVGGNVVKTMTIKNGLIVGIA